VGIIGQDLMEQKIGHVLSSRYPLCSADRLMTELRSVKTEREIAVISYTYHIAEAGVRAAFAAIREGIREYEVAAEAEHAMRLLGGEGTGIDTMVATGPDHSRPVIARASDRRIMPHEIGWLTVVPKCQGYHAAIGRPFSIGAPHAPVAEAVQLAAEAQRQIVANLKPGGRGREVENAGRTVMATKGLDRYYAYIGFHSVGMMEFEPPIFFSGSDARIRENMTLSVDVPCFLASWGGFRLEVGYRITRDGCVALDAVQPGLVVVE
jgi:Xaa-Pro aminopeptidase